MKNTLPQGAGESSPPTLPDPIDWDQMKSLLRLLSQQKQTAHRLRGAYGRSQVKVTNRINILSKLSNELIKQASNIHREIDRHLTDLRKIRAGEISHTRRPADSPQQTAIRPKLERS